MEYAIYPFEEMRITQRHDKGNHLAHWKPLKDWGDKPWDEACKDINRSYFVPQNDFKVVEKSGSQEYGYNIRLTSVNKLKIPFKGDLDYLHITLTHLNYDDYSKLSVGQIIKKNQKILREGMSGNASGNHFHITANLGKYYGFKKNLNGKYCFAYEKSLLPNEAFYINKEITTIYSTNGYKFKEASFLPSRGYYKKGDSGEKISKIDDWFANKVKGNYFGDYTVAIVKEFQRQKGLEQDGNIGPITLALMVKEGFKY